MTFIQPEGWPAFTPTSKAGFSGSLSRRLCVFGDDAPPSLCVCVCVCVREREKESERERARERECARESQSERESERERREREREREKTLSPRACQESRGCGVRTQQVEFSVTTSAAYKQKKHTILHTNAIPSYTQTHHYPEGRIFRDDPRPADTSSRPQHPILHKNQESHPTHKNPSYSKNIPS